MQRRKGDNVAAGNAKGFKIERVVPRQLDPDCSADPMLGRDFGQKLDNQTRTAAQPSNLRAESNA